MGFKDFFGKIAGKVRNAGRWVADKAKQGISFVGRVAKPVLNVVSQVLNAAKYLPGKLGAISKLASPLVNVINGFIDKLPSGRAKDKMQEITNKGKEAIDSVERGSRDIVNRFNEKVQPYAPVVDYINNKIGAAKPMVVHTLGPQSNIVD